MTCLGLGNIAHFSVLYCHLPLRTNQLDEQILIIPHIRIVMSVYRLMSAHPDDEMTQACSQSMLTSPGLGLRPVTSAAASRWRPGMTGPGWSSSSPSSAPWTSPPGRAASTGMACAIRKTRIFPFGSIFAGTHTLNSISCQTEGDLIESDLLLSNRENIFSERSKRRTKTLANTNNPRYIYISFANLCLVFIFSSLF